MLEAKTASPARASKRSILSPRVTAAGITLSLLVVAGIATTIPAAAAQSTAASVKSAETKSSAKTLDAIAGEAQTALDEAEAALAQVSSVSGDIAASDLDIGVDDASVDTTALRSQIHKLSSLDVMPLLLLPDLTDEMEDHTDAVLERTTDLSDRLDAAEEKQAAEEAAAEAKAAAKKAAEKAAAAKKAATAAATAEAAKTAAAEAAAATAAEEEAAAAEEAPSSSSAGSTGTPTGATVTPSGSNTAAAAQAYARAYGASTYGWGDDQYSCLVSLWQKESGWNYQAYNGGSGATGIPQALPGSKMASAGSDWQTNAATQVRWGMGYISARYGTPCGAWGHSGANGWY
ncbi:aggregation-promoting factor C-terminal-like domain-containing protein (plasmid) [Coraliomargarita sp. W4R53]